MPSPLRKKLRKVSVQEAREEARKRREQYAEIADELSSRNGYQYNKSSEINLPKKKKKIKKKKKTKKKTLFDIIDMDE